MLSSYLVVGRGVKQAPVGYPPVDRGRGQTSGAAATRVPSAHRVAFAALARTPAAIPRVPNERNCAPCRFECSHRAAIGQHNGWSRLRDPCEQTARGDCLHLASNAQSAAQLEALRADERPGGLFESKIPLSILTIAMLNLLRSTGYQIGPLYVEVRCRHL